MYKRLGKRIICGLLAILLIFGCFGANSSLVSGKDITTSEASTAKEGKKFISVVYDDSHSMIRSGNWAYCNYAFQLFASLCEDVDDFFVTYMSNSLVSDNLFYNQESMQGVVDKIRNNIGMIASTPITSVETAFNKLCSIESSDVNDEYWLVIMSDGVFNAGETESGETDMNACLDEYSKVMMPNNTNVHTIYLSIGNEAVTPNNNEDKQIFVECATNSEEIVEALVDISKIIFGYIEISNVNFAEYHLTSDTEMEFSSKINLSKVIVINHKSSAVVADVTRDTGQSLLHSSSVSLHYPVRENIQEDTTLIGSENSIKSDSVIATGSYIFTFSQQVSQDSVLVLVKPDVELVIELYHAEDDTPITQEDAILQSDKLNIKLKLIEKSTGRELKAEEISNHYVFSLTTLNDSAVLEEGGKELNNARLELDAVTIRGVFRFDDNMLDSMKVIYPTPYVVYTIEGTTQDNYKYGISNVFGKSVETNFVIYGNGQKLNRKEIKQLDLQFYPQKFAAFIRLDSECKANGDMVVRAKIASDNIFMNILFGWIPAWMIRDRSIDVHAQLYSPYQDTVIKETVSVALNSGPWYLTLWRFLQPILMLILIMGYVMKKRFEHGSKISICRLEYDGDVMVAYRYEWFSVRLDKYKPLAKYHFIPFMPERIELGDCVIYADSYFWSKRKKILVKCENKSIRKVKLVDAATISSNEDIVLKKNSKRIKKEFGNKDMVYIHYQEGVLFVLENYAVLCKFTI